MSPPWPPLPGKAVEFFFSASPQSLSLRFNLAPVLGGQAFSISSVDVKCLDQANPETQCSMLDGLDGQGK